MAVTAPDQLLVLDQPTQSRTVHRRRSRGLLLLRILLAALGCLVMIFSLYVMVVTAFTGNNILAQTLDLWPRRFSLASFQRVFAAWPIGTWFVNSVVVSVITTVLTTVVSVTAGYALAKLDFPPSRSCSWCCCPP